MSLLTSFFDEQKIEYVENLKLSDISSFKIGGLAEIAVFPKNENELAETLIEANKLGSKVEIIGNASNILFSDDGYNGILIFTKNINEVSINQTVITASCGAKLSSLAVLAKKHSLSGLEFAYGIPGTVGGAIAMNAGAYGGEMSGIVLSSRIYDIDKNEFLSIDLSSHKFGYRKSIFTINKKLVCVSSQFTLTESDAEDIESAMRSNAQKRRASQPLDMPNCGSYFKRPEGHFAAKLIDDCGLKGYSVGGACVSPKHAGFIVNTGNATAKDVLELSTHIKQVVFDNFGVSLEEEVKYVG